MKIAKERIKEIMRIYKGLIEVKYRGKLKALERNKKFLSELGSTITPENFFLLALTTDLKIPEPYRREIRRYENILLHKIGQLVGVNLAKARIKQMLGIPGAKQFQLMVEKGKRRYRITVKRNKIELEELI